MCYLGHRISALSLQSLSQSMDQTARSVRASSARGGDFKVPNTVSADIQNRACWRSHFLSEIGTKAPWRSLRFRPPGRERRTCWPAVREARWRGREEERDGCREGGREEREGGREGGRKECTRYEHFKDRNMKMISETK